MKSAILWAFAIVAHAQITLSQLGPHFGLVSSLPVDGAIWAQPVLAGGRVIIATMHDSLYSYTNSGALAWRVSVGTSRTVYPSPEPLFYGGEVGCVSSPAADSTYLYAVCATPSTWVLHKIALLSGAESANVTISASGFDPTRHLQRPGLVLANSRVYVAFGSFDDQSPWHGWLIAYDTATLAQVAVFNTTPTGNGGAIWQAGAAPVVDSVGNLYALTGNGDFDGAANFGESVLKFSPSLALLDWWTPANFATLNTNDQDLSSGRPILMPGTPLVGFGGKDGRFIAVDSTCMGHLQGSASGCPPAQVISIVSVGSCGNCGIYGGTFTQGAAYLPTVGGPVYRVPLTGSAFGTPVAGPASYAFPGATMATAGSILWAVSVGASNELSPQPGTLRALNPADLSEYWNSGTFGTASKFVSPVVTNWRVYVATQDNRVLVFGSIPAASIRGQAAIRGHSGVR